MLNVCVITIIRLSQTQLYIHIFTCTPKAALHHGIIKICGLFSLHLAHRPYRAWDMWDVCMQGYLPDKIWNGVFKFTCKSRQRSKTGANWCWALWIHMHVKRIQLQRKICLMLCCKKVCRVRFSWHWQTAVCRQTELYDCTSLLLGNKMGGRYS